MKLSRNQKIALEHAFKNDGVVDTFNIKGSTGYSLYKRGLFYRHAMPGDDEGCSVSYELTDKGREVARALQDSQEGE